VAAVGVGVEAAVVGVVGEAAAVAGEVAAVAGAAVVPSRLAFRPPGHLDWRLATERRPVRR
jgi:hypothetical protein